MNADDDCVVGFEERSIFNFNPKQTLIPNRGEARRGETVRTLFRSTKPSSAVATRAKPFINPSSNKNTWPPPLRLILLIVASRLD